MKTQNKIPTETEKYYAAKNKRREWWSENWDNFLYYPAMAIVIAAGVASAIILLTAIIFSIGMWAFKPQLIKLIKENTPAPVAEMASGQPSIPME